MPLALLSLVLGIAAAAPQAPAAPPPFEVWLEGVRTEGLARGLQPATLDLALTGLALEPVVVERDRAQPEQTLTLDAYIQRRLTAAVVAAGRARLAGHRALLRRVEAATGVPGPILVAIWGLESNYGRFTGTRPTIAALATLAYDSRRPALFRAELFHALTILDRGLVPPGALVGSWAGAMGQPQFMPSAFLRHAVDFDGDGRIDIWRSEADVLGSMGHYLRSAGWTAGERWGREVRVPRAVLEAVDRAVPRRTGGCRAEREMTVARPLGEWTALGVTLAGGGRLPVSSMSASLVRGAGRHFLVYRNYGAVLDYNCSNAYAVSVGLLADRLAAR